MSFQVIPPDGTKENHDHNWRNFAQSMYAGAWNPLANGATASITGTGLLASGYYTQAIHGVLFFNITFTVTSGNITMNWANNQYIILPKPMTYLGAQTGGYPQTVFDVQSPNTGTVSGTKVTLVNNGKLGTLTNLSGGTISVTTVPIITIQGFYFTGK